MFPEIVNRLCILLTFLARLARLWHVWFFRCFLVFYFLKLVSVCFSCVSPVCLCCLWQSYNVCIVWNVRKTACMVWRAGCVVLGWCFLGMFAVVWCAVSCDEEVCYVSIIPSLLWDLTLIIVRVHPLPLPPAVTLACLALVCHGTLPWDCWEWFWMSKL